MPTFVLFITLAIVLAIILAFIVLTPWLRADKSAQNNQLIVLNVAVFQKRIEELSADYAAGRMSEDTFKQQKTELERQLLQASDDASADTISTSNNAATDTAIYQTNSFTQTRKARLTIVICVPLLIGLGYAMAADRTPVVKLWLAQDTLGGIADDLVTGKIDVPPDWAATDSVALLSAIQTNVHQHAYDPKRWMHLSDIYLAYKANDQALEALARAYRLAPTDETIAVRYAQTQFFIDEGRLNQDSYQALKNVLTLNPEHQGAQMLMAMGEARSGNFNQAQVWVDKLRFGISQREGDHSAALQSLDKLSANISQQADNGTIPSQNTDNTLNNVMVSVTLNSSLLPLIEPSDTLYITIKENTGGAPLAVKKLLANQFLQASSQTLRVELSDKDAMMTSHTLSSAMSASKSLIITARVSKSGQALTQSGDLAATAIPLEYSTDQTKTLSVAIEIDQQVP